MSSNNEVNRLLALSLINYVSTDDVGLERNVFLQYVADRIIDDLDLHQQIGSPLSTDSIPAPADSKRKITVWSVTTTDDFKTNTTVHATKLDAADNVRNLMSDIPGGDDYDSMAAYTNPPDLEAIRYLWELRFDDPCIIKRHVIEV